MEFVKMHGAGNDFIIIEDLDGIFEKNEQEIAKKLCHRNFGIGADGLVIIRKSNISDIKMVIINSDGSRANMCGNATRCFGRYVYDKGLVQNSRVHIETGDGEKIVNLLLEDDKFKSAKVFMGKPSFNGKDFGLLNKKNLINEVYEIGGKDYKLTTMLMGVPHTIVIRDKEEYDVTEGKNIEKYSLFSEGTNVNFVKIIDNNKISVETWERGAGATLACGTGCCASVAYTSKEGLTSNNVKVNAPGGILHIDITEDGVYMTGDAKYICKGTAYLD
ncbi:MAG: diaminopimelate epimerase [Clostridium sp.]